MCTRVSRTRDLQRRTAMPSGRCRPSAFRSLPGYGFSCAGLPSRCPRLACAGANIEGSILLNPLQSDNLLRARAVIGRASVLDISLPQIQFWRIARGEYNKKLARIARLGFFVSHF
jgi:hypothetical protein